MRTLTLASLAWLVPAAALAQAAAPAPPPRTEGSAEFALVATTGNSATQSLGLGGTLTYRPDPWELKWKAGFVRNESDNQLSAESFTALFRADRKLGERLSAFGQYDFLRDRFAGVSARNVVAGGVSYLLVNQAPHELKVDGGLGYNNEQRIEGEDLSSAIALAGLAYKLKISETAEVTDDMRFDASLANGDQWRWDNTVALSAKVTTVFSLKLSNVIRYANAPVAGFDTTDTITSVALVAKF